MNTNFHFEVLTSVFPEALEKFSAFFTHPNLDAKKDPSLLKKVDDLFQQ
jgi:secreted Zn-dependent insulinase-like peptidase